MSYPWFSHTLLRKLVQLAENFKFLKTFVTTVILTGMQTHITWFRNIANIWIDDHNILRYMLVWNSMLILILLLLYWSLQYQRQILCLKLYNIIFHETLDNKRGATLISSFLCSRVFCSIVLLRHNIQHVATFMQWNSLLPYYNEQLCDSCDEIV